MYRGNGGTLVNPSGGEKCQRRRLGSLTVRIAVVPLLLIGANICTHAAPVGLAGGAQSVRSQPMQHKPAPSRNDYVPPTAAEMSPMPSAYLEELAKIHEPPEMADKPMQVRRPVLPAVREIGDVINALGSPDKATHAQRVAALHKLIALAGDNHPSGLAATTYGAIATIACINGDSPKTVIEYTRKATGNNDNGARGYDLALRARMYLTEGNKSQSLDDLEKLMVRNDGGALLLDGGVAPQNKPTTCGWSIPSLDGFGSDPRGLAAKGLYLSSFVGFGYENKKPNLEADIRSLYARSERSWPSPIPYFLAAVTLDGLGSEELTASTKCVRGLPPLGESTACAKYDNDVMRDIRELTMALVIDPNFGPALSARAEKYLGLAQDYYADGKPSLKLFKLAIADFSAAIMAPGTDKSALYNDRGIAFASIGEYASAAASYARGMNLAKHGAEKFASVYEQLAGVYMKMERFNEAARTLTDAIMNSGTGLQNVVILGDLKAFRDLYPQYDLVPNKIVAEDVRRRYVPQFPESWDSSFISGSALQSSCVTPNGLAGLYALRGDAYMKADQRGAALADYHRVKSDAWCAGTEMPYFTADGERNYDVPTPWPAPPPVH